MLILLNMIISLFTFTVSDSTRLIPLSDIMQNEFSLVTQIDVRYGDGKRLIIQDMDQISEIVRFMKEIQLEKLEYQTPSQGYLYYMDLTIEDKKVRYFSDLKFDKIGYKANQQTKELNKFMLEYGRKTFPNLLPGITL
jgi:hypothetical protein